MIMEAMNSHYSHKGNEQSPKHSSTKNEEIPELRLLFQLTFAPCEKTLSSSCKYMITLFSPVHSVTEEKLREQREGGFFDPAQIEINGTSKFDP